MNNKQLLQQYADTGIELPEYQIKSLPSDLLKTYIRKRLIAAEGGDGYLSDYEFELLTSDQRFQYVIKSLENGYIILNKQFELLTPDQRFQYAMKRMEKGYGITDKQFKLLTPEQQKIFKDKGGKIYWR